MANMWHTLEEYEIKQGKNKITIELFEETFTFYVWTTTYTEYEQYTDGECYLSKHTEKRQYKSRNAAMNQVRKLLKKYDTY